MNNKDNVKRFYGRNYSKDEVKIVLLNLRKAAL